MKSSIRYGIEGADAYYMLGKSFEHEDEPKLGLPYMQRAAELAPDDLQIRLAYGILLCTLELFEQAEKELQYVIDKDWNNADAHYNLGVLFAVSTERIDDAMYHLKQAFTLQPEFEQARYIHDMLATKKN